MAQKAPSAQPVHPGTTIINATLAITIGSADVIKIIRREMICMFAISIIIASATTKPTSGPGAGANSRAK